MDAEAGELAERVTDALSDLSLLEDVLTMAAAFGGGECLQPETCTRLAMLLASDREALAEALG